MGLLFGGAHAQTTAPPVPSPTPSAPPLTPPSATPPTAPPARLNIVAVQVEGNTLLSQQALDALTASAVGPNRTMTDLRAAAARVQAAYRDAGYGGVVAFVPEQDVSSGRVVIRVLEGKLAAVRVKGNQHFSEANIRAGLPALREGATPVVRTIDRDIQLSNENPAKEVRVTLAPGARPGEIDAEVAVQDMNPLQLLLAANNTGSPATGRSRVAVGVRHANLTGRDDVGTFQYQTSPENASRVQVATVGYHVPIYSMGASVDLFYAHSNVDNGTSATPVGPLSFVGKGDLFSSRFNYGLERRGDLDQRVSLGLDYKDFENDCALGPFSCGPVGVSVKAIPVSIGYTAQREPGDGSSWGLSGSLSVNAGGSSAATFDAARPGATRHYAIGRLSAFGDWPLATGWSLNMRLESQFTPHALIAGERFGVGGLASVRGYEERELTGDWGLALRSELLFPAFDGGGFRLRPLAFIDAGHVANHKGGTCLPPATTSCSAASVGVGARAGFGSHVSATLDVGYALKDAAPTSRGDTRVHVSVTVSY